jgi:hypothetical protein
MTKGTLRQFFNGEEDSFRLGVDWTIDPSGRPFLLEYNFTVPQEGGDPTNSRLRHFLDVSQDKLFHHEMFEDMMPRYVRRNEEENFGRKVYKSRTGSGGVGVSINEKPDGHYDFIEEFVEPKSVEVDGKRYPYVFRDYTLVEIVDGRVNWKNQELFRKQSIVALEDAEDETVYKLNTSSKNAEKTEVDEFEKRIIIESTDRVMRRALEFGFEINWNPAKAFSDPVIGYYIGQRAGSALGAFGYPSEFQKLGAELLERENGAAIYLIVGDLNRAMQAAEWGSDLVLLTRAHSFKDYSHFTNGLRIKFFIDRNDDKINHWISHQMDGRARILETFDSRDNVYLLDEKTPEEFADLVEEKYN